MRRRCRRDDGAWTLALFHPGDDCLEKTVFDVLRTRASETMEHARRQVELDEIVGSGNRLLDCREIFDLGRRWHRVFAQARPHDELAAGLLIAREIRRGDAPNRMPLVQSGQYL